MKLLFMLNSGFDTYGPSLHLYKALFEDLLKAGHTIHLLESVSTRKDPVIPDSIEKHPNFSYELIPYYSEEEPVCEALSVRSSI